MKFFVVFAAVLAVAAAAEPLYRGARPYPRPAKYEEPKSEYPRSEYKEETPVYRPVEKPQYKPEPAYPARPAYKPAEPAYKAEPAYPAKPAYEPAYPAKPAYEPAYKAGYNAEYEEPTYPKEPYNFEYAVKDEYDDYGRHEESDGKVVTGSYHVVLPDGRKQTVQYKADPYTGFTADVSYEGEAKYPEYVPAKKAAYPKEPAYPTKSAYKPAYAEPVKYEEPAYHRPAYPAKPAYPEPEYKPEYKPAVSEYRPRSSYSAATKY